MSLQTSIALTLSALRAVAMSGNSANERHSKSVSLNWPDGSGTSQADQVWSDDRSLPAGAETHDLNSLTQLDDAGATLRSAISFANVKALLIKNTNTPGAAGVLTVGNSVGTPWDGAGTPFVQAAGEIDIPAGGTLLWISPVGGASGAGAKDLLMTATGATVTYEIVVVGDAT